jgi:hypothetical protein
MLEKSSVQTRAPGRGDQRFPAMVREQRLQILWPTGHDHPFRGFLPGGPAQQVQAVKRGQAGVLGQIAHHGFEIKSSIADVECQETVVREFPQIQLERFGRSQVDGNRVRAERIDDEQVVAMIGRAFEPQSGVAEN